MAVPTITNLAPDNGPTKGGNLVVITGTNFRLPPAPPSGYVGGEQQKTVSVQVEGQESPWAYAASATQIYARVPEWRGSYDVTFPLALDVRVANLDDDEMEIPGENVTLPGGYSIYQPSLTGESYLQRVCRELIRLFRRHILANSHITSGRIYDLDPGVLEERLRAESPVVHLIGPRTPLNRFYSINREEPEQDPTDAFKWLRKEVPVTVDVEFDIRIWTSGEASSRQLFGLHNALVTMFRDIVDLRVPNDPSDPDQGYKDYELVMPWTAYPEDDTSPNDSDLRDATSGCTIRGVHLIDEPDTIKERGWYLSANDGEPVLENEPL